MKKSLRILVALSVVASTVFSLQPAKAIGFAFDTVGVLTSAQISSCEIDLGPGNSFKFTANINTTISKVQVYVGSWGGPAYDSGAKIYHDASNSPGALLGELSTTTHPSILYESGIITFVASSPLEIDSGSIYWLEINSGFACARTSSAPTYTGSEITTIYNGNTIRMFRGYAGYSDSVSVMFAIFTQPPVTFPGAPTSVTAASTGATTANVSFTAPSINGGAAITSYTATTSPGGLTGTISQAGSGTIAMTGLTAGTAYTFTVTATNSAGTSAASSASNSTTTVGAPTSPTSVVATATGKRSATVSFAAPASNGGSAVISYTATSTPGGLVQTLTQSTGGSFNFDGLQPATAYTFAVTATNAIGTSATATSNSVTTTPLVVASLSSLSFADDGTGTGGKIVWSGTSIDAVLYTGSSAYYPGPYNYGAFTGGWNGRIRNLTPGTEYTVSLFVVSSDGVGESKSLTFKTSAALPAPAGAASATISRADEVAAQLPKLFAWIDENTFVEGEGNRMKMMLNKFNALVTSPHRSHIKVPISRVSNVVATSLTPLACSVVSATAKENAGVVKALSGDTCTISYTVSGGSRAPATMAKDFAFKKFAN
jgi:hypothetical protein